MARRLITPAAVAAVVAMAALAAVVAVDNDDGIEWWRWGGRSMAAAAFGGNGDGYS